MVTPHLIEVASFETSELLPATQGENVAFVSYTDQFEEPSRRAPVRGVAVQLKIESHPDESDILKMSS